MGTVRALGCNGLWLRMFCFLSFSVFLLFFIEDTLSLSFVIDSLINKRSFSYSKNFFFLSNIVSKTKWMGLLDNVSAPGAEGFRSNQHKMGSIVFSLVWSLFKKGNLFL